VQHLIPAIRIKIFFTILVGLIYPLLMTGVSHILFPRQASGDFLSRGGQVIGSHWISQKFEKPQYFWSRPSAVDYNPLPSGGSNLGQASQDLKKSVVERRAKLKAAYPDQAGDPPQDLLFASGSGLDPDFSPEAAEYQVQRVARARSMTVPDVQKLVAAATLNEQFGLFGEPTVNVLALNLALDHAQGVESAPVQVPTPAPAK
jgi:K+-transporting ATPase ATPase C chain